MDRKYKDTEHKEVEILTEQTPSLSKRTRMCGFDPEMWKKQYPGLKTDSFTNIQAFCQ